MELVKPNSQILKTVCDRFDFENPIRDPKELFEEMRDFMCKNKGLGLAAPQVGINTQMFVIGDPTNSESCIGVFNPTIVNSEGEEVLYEEGCLSYPLLFIKVKRPSAIRVRFTTWNGETDTVQFSGMTARVFQHELDHLNGVCFTDRANLYHRTQGFNHQKKLQRKIKS
jgi:peptide deformylase